jgi:hypothetical protein
MSYNLALIISYTAITQSIHTNNTAIYKMFDSIFEVFDHNFSKISNELTEMAEFLALQLDNIPSINSLDRLSGEFNENLNSNVKITNDKLTLSEKNC